MRSSALTIVSRTRERIDSLRRSLRGRFVRSACSRLRLSLFGIVLIFFLADSPEKIPRAAAGAETAPGLLERAILAEPFSAHHTPLEMHDLFGVAAADTAAIFDARHERAARNFKRANLFSISCLRGGVAQMARAGVS